MPEETFDLLVIGAGPGGYVCANRAAQLGLKTALVERRPTLGGVCLNVGCIPTKALLHSTELYREVRDHGSHHGITVDGIRPDIAALMRAKEQTVSKLVGGIDQLCKARNIEVFHGSAEIARPGEIVVRNGDSVCGVRASNIVIATGSVPVELPDLPFDGTFIVSSDEAIAFETIPKRLAVIGAGAIGLELGSVWSRLGSEVTILEFLPQVAATFDKDIGKIAERALKKQGIQFKLSARVTGIRKPPGGHFIVYEQNGETHELETDVVLVAVGRRPAHDGLGLQKLGVRLDSKGRIEVDNQLRASVNGIWAIGDVIAGPMLAHKAEEEGVAVAQRIAGKPGHVNYDLIPNVIYTKPELAAVGLTEQEAKNRKVSYKVGKFPLTANGRALAAGATDGIVKILADAQSDRLLGAQIISPNASELIASIVAHMEYGGSAEDLGNTIHAHPTVSEAIKEAALAVSGSAIHAL